MPEFALGYDWGNGFAVEFNYQQSGGAMKGTIRLDDDDPVIFTSTTSGDLIFTSEMVKGIYNIQTNNTGWYNPYIGFGIGRTIIHYDKATYAHSSGESVDLPADDNSAVSMQLTFGNRFKFNQSWFGDIAANYTRIDSLTYINESDLLVLLTPSKVTSISFALGKSF